MEEIVVTIASILFLALLQNTLLTTLDINPIYLKLKNKFTLKKGTQVVDYEIPPGYYQSTAQYDPSDHYMTLQIVLTFPLQIQIQYFKLFYIMFRSLSRLKITMKRS